MALHRYIIDVEYNDDSTSHPLTVTVSESDSSQVGEYTGKKLLPLLRRSVKAIALNEIENDPCPEI